MHSERWRLCHRLKPRFESLENRDLLTVVATLGNPPSADYQLVDGWASNLVVNETDSFTNETDTSITLDAGQFRFRADRLGGPVTPLLVRVNGDNDFSVLGVGQSRDAYAVGENSYAFAGSGAGVVVQPGETIAAGFLDAFSDGSGGSAGAVVAFNVGGGADEVWLTGGPSGTDSASVGGGLISPGAFSSGSNRDYAFEVTLEASDQDVLAFAGAGFESPVLGATNEAAESPAGWVRSGDGTLGIQRNGFGTNPEGTQFAYLQDNAILTTGVGVATIEPGIYTASVDVGNASGGGATQEPGTYIVRLGYGRDANDFNELATDVLDGDFIAEGSWQELTVEATVSNTSDAIGQRLMVQVEHVAFDNPLFRRTRGWIDDLRVVRRDAAPVLELPDWPTAPGQALISDKYRVWVTQDGVRREVQVLMSESRDYTNPTGSPPNTHGRTFSWIALSSNYAKDVTIEVEKLFGVGATDTEVLPSGYGLEHTRSADGKTVTFDLNRPRYVTVNFNTTDNFRRPDGMIENMLAIFADPLEEERPDPTAPGTVVVTPNTTQSQLNNAAVIYFPKGFYNFREMFGASALKMRSGQTVYTEPGAFILGYIGNASGQSNNMTVIGRGAFSGREEIWKTDPHDLIELDGSFNRIEGVFVFDGNHHGVVPGFKAHIERVKLWGWHYNNDGFRSWGGVVHDTFQRPVDDAFYVAGGALTVTNNVILQGLNGGVVTYGWGDYTQSGFVLKDSHVVSPEWRGLHNNNGLIMSQSPATVEQYDVRFENIIIDGDLPGVTNIKLGSNHGTTVPSNEIGELRGLTLKNVTVNGTFLNLNYDRNQSTPSRSLLEGTVLNGGADKFMVQDVTFENLFVNGEYITEESKDQYFDIDAETTSGIEFFVSTPPQTAAVADLNLDGVVNAADYTVWRDNRGAEGAIGQTAGDVDQDGDVDDADRGLFWANYGATGVVTPIDPRPIQSPYGGQAVTLAAGERLEAEHYDLGGQGVAFNDTTPETIGSPARPEAVDGGPIGGASGERVGWIAAGEWLEYTVDTVAGIYDLGIRYAAGSAQGGSLRLLLADGPGSESFTELGVVDLPATAGWSDFQTATLPGVTLGTTVGSVLRIELLTSGFDLDYLEVFSA